MASVLSQHAGGRLQGMAGEAGLMELLSGITGNMAELDTREVQPWENDILGQLPEFMRRSIEADSAGYGGITGFQEGGTKITKGSSPAKKRKDYATTSWGGQ
jgi:hypothetical protein